MTMCSRDPKSPQHTFENKWSYRPKQQQGQSITINILHKGKNIHSQQLKDLSSIQKIIKMIFNISHINNYKTGLEIWLSGEVPILFLQKSQLEFSALYIRQLTTTCNSSSMAASLICMCWVCLFIKNKLKKKKLYKTVQRKCLRYGERCLLRDKRLIMNNMDSSAIKWEMIKTHRMWKKSINSQ